MSLLNLTRDGHRDAAGWLRAHLTGDGPGKAVIAKHGDLNRLAESLTGITTALLLSRVVGEPLDFLARLEASIDDKVPPDRPVYAGLLSLTARGHHEAVAWLRVHVLDDAEAKAELLARGLHGRELLESLTDVLVTLVRTGVVGRPLKFVARLTDDVDRLFVGGEGDGPAAA